jgi:hypothetical protein
MKKVTFFFLTFIVCSLYLHASDPLQQYVARYKFPPGSVLTEINVVLDNGVLSLTSPMGNAVIEKSGSTDTFSIISYNGTAVFTRNESKKVNGLKIDVMGVSLEGIKEERENAGSGSVLPALPVSRSTFPMKYLPAMLTGDVVE